MIRTFSQLNSSLSAYGKVLGLTLMILLGILFPQFGSLSFLIQYLLIAMLFLAFLDIEFRPGSFHKRIFWVVLANILIAFAGYGILHPLSPDLALTAFITGIAPTAIAAPVIIGFLQGQVEFAAAAVLLGNLTMSLVLPAALPFVAGDVMKVSTWQVLRPVLATMLIPLVLARASRLLPQEAQSAVRRGKAFSFALWLLALLISTAKASEFLRSDGPASAADILPIALVSLVVCIVNFSVGALLGGGRFRQESSQSLGQKNNAFVIWVALTFLNPLAALGPTFYILYHNLYNSWQIYRFERRRGLPR